MQFKLSKPVEIYDKIEGKYLQADDITVSFRGRNGLASIKQLQDLVFTTMRESAATAAKNPNAEEKQAADITVADLVTMLDMSGKSAVLFEKGMDCLIHNATIGTSRKFDKNIQDDIGIEDLEKLWEEVLRNFLLPKVIQKLNNMSK